MADKEGLLPFKLIEEEFGEALTSYGGLPLVVETCEALGLGRLVTSRFRTPSRFRSWPQETRAPLSLSPTTALTSVQG